MDNRRERNRFPWVQVASLAAFLVSGCGSPPTIGGGTTPGGGAGGSVTIPLGVGGVIASSNGQGGTGGGTAVAAVWPPQGFINVTNSTTGAYALGPDISGAAGAAGSGGSTGAASVCAGLFGVVRDFKMGNQAGGHPDFETMPVGLDTGIVDTTLGTDGFGRSDTRPNLRRFFEVDAESTVIAGGSEVDDITSTNLPLD